jgi:3-dehydroquinate synthase
MTDYRIQVTGDSAYEIVVGRALLDHIVSSIPKSCKKICIIHQAALTHTAEVLVEALKAAGFEAIQAAIPDGEDAKRIEVASWIWGLLGKSEFSRIDYILGLGGGAATDLAGFVASTWLRGVPLVLVPTTLLGMVDAAVGGKTGINTSEGKNLVGSFYAPVSVFCDLDTLVSLPRNELLAGFGEVAKYGFISDPEILTLIEQDLQSATDVNSELFADIVRRCIAIKAKVVSSDFKEAGVREILNYGHTLGHAIELTERYSWRHGAAISVGMVFVAELARLAGRLSDEAVQRHRRVLNMLGLPVSYRADRWDQLLVAMQRDKKSRGGELRFIVLDDIAKPTVMKAPTTEMLFTAFQEICE